MALAKNVTPENFLENLIKAPTHQVLPAETLRWRPEPETFSFVSTDELEPLDGIIGQRRALEAITLGAEIGSPGYNIFVNGISGTGRLSTIEQILAGVKTNQEDIALCDLGYVNNFEDPDRPAVLRLRKGQIIELRKDMREAIGHLRSSIPAMFEEDRYRKGRSKIVERFQKREKEMVGSFEEKIKPDGFILGQRKIGPNMSQPEILPVIEGTPYSVDDLDDVIKEEKLTIEAARKINERIDELQDDLYELIKEGKKLAADFRRKTLDYERRHATLLVQSTLEDIKTKYKHQSVDSFIRQVRRHILEHLELFRKAGEESDEEETAIAEASVNDEISIEDPFHVYEINVLLDNSATEGRPIILERNPSFINIFGTIDRTRDEDGRWLSDFSSIKEGSILQADGGFLIMNAVDALSEPGVWTMLKRVLLHRKLQIQPLEHMLRYSGSPTGLAVKPEQIRLNVKVVLIGPSSLYQALFHAEEDFRKIFKINAQFDYAIDRDPEMLASYARFVAKLTKEEDLLPFSAGGVSAVTEFAVERAGTAGKISLRFSDIADSLRESSYWAQKSGSKIVEAEHVKEAIEKMIDRNSMWKEKIMERIEEGTLMISTDGGRVGQINGLAVYDLGQVSFGKPSRITATVSVGLEGIINIDREANLSGNIYHKGTLIITGYFNDRFAQNEPISFSASIVFEQSYGGIDGDSASSTEVYALLSALSDVPIRQDLAVTGSVNQWGEIQPIGGVNEKIEGFFDVCRQRGLTGRQGVLIPVQNVPELMLRGDVVEAVEKGEFHVYPVTTIDQGIEILTGVSAGERSREGSYPENTINGRVSRRLQELTEKVRYHNRLVAMPENNHVDPGA